MKRTAIVLIVVVVAVCAFGYFGFNQMRTRMAEAAKKPAQDEITVERGDVTSEVVEAGFLEANKTVEVKSRVGGRLAKLFVDEGDTVKAGQVIAVIDPQETQLQVDQSQAQLTGAEASVRQTQVDIAQRRVTVETNLTRARSRLAQLERQQKAQPQLTQAAIQSAETAYRSASQALALLDEVTHPNARLTAEKAVTDAQNNLAQSEKELERRRTLLERGYISQREVEQQELQVELNQTQLARAQDAFRRIDDQQAIERRRAEENVNQARAELDRATVNSIQDDAAREQYRQALQDVRDAETARSDVQRLAAVADQQRAQARQISIGLRDRQRELGETEIRAPMDGIVTKRSVQVGELVSSLSSFNAGTPLVTIEDRSSMVVNLEINEIDVAKLTLDKPASIEVDALPTKDFRGRVTKIAPANTTAGAQVQAAGADPVVKYAVEVRLENVDPALKSGMSARCTMIVRQLKNVVRIPLDFVGQEGRDRFVMVIPATGKGEPKRTPVQLGEASGAYVAVLTGVDAGQKLKKPKFTGPSRRGVIQFGAPDREEDEKGDKADKAEGASGDKAGS